MNNQEFTDISLLFPAFGIDYSEEEFNAVNSLSIDIESYFNSALPIIGVKFAKTHLMDQFNELNSQYLAYIYSAVLADYFKKNGIYSRYISAYSMGIYASLYYAGAYDFMTGLELIRDAYNLTVEAISGNKFGMAGVIGFDYDSLIDLISNNSKSVEIVNENNRLSFVIAGYYDEIENIVKLLLEEGAMNTRVLPIKSCYHTQFNKSASDKFKAILDKKHISSIKMSYVSSINQEIINSSNDIKKELCNNLSMKLNWHSTMNKMISIGIKNYFECGLGKSLFKIARFIDGDFKIHTLKNIDNILKIY
jgi:malonyl CoA-acyl carrier protein transacylase